MNYPILLSIVAAGALASCGEIKSSNGGDSSIGNPADAPVITSLSPARGALGGGTEISVTGSGFVGDLVVVLGNIVITEVTVQGDTSLKFTTPAGSEANVAVDVLVYGEDGFGELAESFTYNPAPEIDILAPAFGPLAGGQAIDFKGNFLLDNNDGDVTVTIGGVAASDVVVLDNQTIQATTPPGAVADVALPQDVVVATPNGEVMLPGAFSYVRPGLLFGTKVRNNEGFTLFYLDVMTGRTLEISDLGFGVGRILDDGTGGLLLRHNRTSDFFDSSFWARVDLGDLTISEIGPATLDGNPVRLSSATNKAGGGSFGISRNGQFGSFDPVTLALTQIGATSLTFADRGCLADGPGNSVILLGSDTAPMKSIDVTNGLATNGPPLSGDLPGAAGEELRCHGAASVGTTIFAIFTNGGTNGQLRPASLMAINRATGVATKIVDLPQGSSGLQPTPQGF